MLSKFISIFSSVLLTLGVIVRCMQADRIWTILFFSIGGSLKLFMILFSLYNKTYKPGKEIFLLLTGLAVFFTGMYLRKIGFEYALYIMYAGLSMKVVFVFLYSKSKRALKDKV